MPPQIDPDKLAPLNITLPLRIGAILVIISLGLTGLHLVKKEYRETLTFLVTALATSAGGASAVYALRSIKQSTESQELDRQKRLADQLRDRQQLLESQELDRQQLLESQLIDRTLLYIARWNDPQYWPARKAAQELCQLKNQQLPSNQESFVIEYLHKNPSVKQDILNLLNFLEEMSMCSKRGMLKEEWLFDYYRGIVFEFCDTFYHLIQRRRTERNNENIFKALTDLRERWRNPS